VDGLNPAKGDVVEAPIGLFPKMEEVAEEGSLAFFDSSFFSSSFLPLSCS